MIWFAIACTVLAAIWTGIVLLANGNSDAPALGFQGGSTIAIVWGVTIIIWLAWYLE